MKAEDIKVVIAIVILIALVVAGIFGTIKQNKAKKALMEFTKGENKHGG